MSSLKTIQIGKNSFNLLHFGDDVVTTRDCHICHCSKLKKISFDLMAFYDYTVLELHDLPALEELSMRRNCFYYGKQFVLQGRICCESKLLISD